MLTTRSAGLFLLHSVLSSEYAFRQVALIRMIFKWISFALECFSGYPVMQDVLPVIQEESTGSCEIGCVSGFPVIIPVTHR